MYVGGARSKNITYNVTEHPGFPIQVAGDARRVRQAISNVVANAIQNTSEGGVSVEMSIASREEQHVEIEICISDTGIGMNPKKLDALFRELEQVQVEGEKPMKGLADSNKAFTESFESEESCMLGLGLAVVSRTLRSMNGQLRAKSEESKGSRFVLVFLFGLPGPGVGQKAVDEDPAAGRQTDRLDSIAIR
jgi:signal transduction histidine kinase